MVGWLVLRERPLRFTPDTITGQALDHFVRHLLSGFGDFQDAMLSGDRTLHHSLLSSYINIGFLTPVEICQRVVEEWKLGVCRSTPPKSSCGR